MRIPSPATKRRVRIEIIPLIDIIFFLLATFVLLSLSMVKNHGISVNVPKSTSNDHLSASKSTTIACTADGKIYFNRQLTNLNGLPALLTDLLKTNPNPNVIISGDEHATFGQPISVLDELRSAGITQVSIETKPSGGASR